MNIEKIAAHQIDPVRDIWMKGSSQGKISGWIQIFEIEENLVANLVDLTDAYGSIPHNLIEHCLKHYNIPEG